ncbi:Alpha/Beta hydrolase protein [Coniella lustricola]|uniref:Alpha/Beta hydrolase protein n=1 Tax=Coniella lustricola TaxID=2025994 RepID=A0A2T3A986_9PEZI|nr:Alpha/Beta hydrolase protein [Coniella lustricola]
MAIENAFSQPLVFAPLSGHHKHTVILLHGRGFNADVFSSQILTTQMSKLPLPIQNCDQGLELGSQYASTGLATNFREALPDTKLIFPWGRKQRATVYKRSIIRQWFDDWHLSPNMTTDVADLRYDEGLQTTALGETVAFLHTLIAKEAELLGGAQKVALGGFSQGGAASLVAALLWSGEEQLAAVVGMSAWLPYQKQMMEHFDSPSSCDGANSLDCDELDLFEQSSLADDSGSDHTSTVTTSLDWLREEIEMPACGRPVSQQPKGTTSVLLCHGKQDQQVYAECGRQATEVFPRFGLEDVVWRTYEDVEHEISVNMLCDVATFLRTKFESTNR